MYLMVTNSQSNCDFIQRSYALCIEDAECSNTFFITEDSLYYQKLFEYLLQKHVIQKNPYIQPMLSQHLCNQTDTSQDMIDLYIIILQSCNICKHNQYYQQGEGCKCTNGKICDEIPGTKLIFRETSFIIFSIFVFIISLFSLYTIIYTQKRTTTKIENQERAFNSKTIAYSTSSASYM